MDLTKEAMEFIANQSVPKTFVVDEIHYTDRDANAILPPQITGLTVHTLSALSDLVSNGFEDIEDGDVLFHVEDHQTVKLIRKVSNEYAQRVQYALATCSQEPRFRFSNYMEPEEFIISLASMFVPGVGDTDYVTQIASNLSSENVAKAEDNGLSQVASIRRGVALASQVTIKSRVALAPYRTFREADQPASEFIFRLKSRENAPPLCALFEADGGRWKLDAITNIAAYLSRNSKDVDVIS